MCNFQFFKNDFHFLFHLQLVLKNYECVKVKVSKRWLECNQSCYTSSQSINFKKIATTFFMYLSWRNVVWMNTANCFLSIYNWSFSSLYQTFKRVCIPIKYQTFKTQLRFYNIKARMGFVNKVRKMGCQLPQERIHVCVWPSGFIRFMFLRNTRCCILILLVYLDSDWDWLTDYTPDWHMTKYRLFHISYHVQSLYSFMYSFVILHIHVPYIFANLLLRHKVLNRTSFQCIVFNAQLNLNFHFNIHIILVLDSKTSIIETIQLQWG